MTSEESIIKKNKAAECGISTKTGQYHVPCIYPAVRNQSPDSSRTLTLEVPGSKSITNRALLLATLAKGKSTLRGTLFSDDSRHFLKCIQELGFETTVDEERKIIEVTGLGGEVPKKEASIYVGSAGTAARFLSAYLGVSHGIYHLDASEQMRRRPMAPLLEGLEELGCEVEYTGREGYFPFTLKAHGFGKNQIVVDIGSSSQFLSALLIASNLAPEDMEIRVEGSHGMAYIRMTEKMMEQFGVRTEKYDVNAEQYDANAEKSGVNKEQRTEISYLIKKGQQYQAGDYQVEPDVSAACYFYAMAPLLGITVVVRNVHFDSLQGDVKFLRILEKMGCKVEETPEGIRVSGRKDGNFRGIEVDMSACSDQTITLAALAPFADSPTRITGIGHIRFQESDRIKAIATELGKMGIVCEEGEDYLKIYPGKPRASLVETYDDHRMAMGFSLTGLRAEGIVINDPMCCRKTFENFFEVLEAVIEKLRSHGN